MSNMVKFRAWIEPYKKMETGLFGIRSDGVVNMRSNDPNFSVTLMQYFDCKDKTGRQLCDGDIVIADWHWTEPYILEFPDDIYGLIEFGLGDENILIIGNKYENPELLEDKS